MLVRMAFCWMTTNLRIVGTLALVAAIAIPLSACEDENAGTFACGPAGGRCVIDEEVCIEYDQCSTCVPAPEACDPGDCDCIGDADFSADPSNPCPVPDGRACSESEASVTLACSNPDFGCG